MRPARFNSLTTRQTVSLVLLVHRNIDEILLVQPDAAASGSRNEIIRSLAF
jgi:hypothetical protein